jgi:hypothetical protein
VLPGLEAVVEAAEEPAEQVALGQIGPKDAVLIARLASELRCYEPERADAGWTRLRHLRARRSQLTTGATSAVNQIRDLAECAWPAVLAATGSPFGSVTWRVAGHDAGSGAPGT